MVYRSRTSTPLPEKRYLMPFIAGVYGISLQCQKRLFDLFSIEKTDYFLHQFQVNCFSFYKTRKLQILNFKNNLLHLTVQKY
jgi:hypothetical protein